VKPTRAELLAEVDRLTAELAEADTAHNNCADPVLVQTLRTEVDKLTAHNEQLRREREALVLRLVHLDVQVVDS